MNIYPPHCSISSQDEVNMPLKATPLTKRRVSLMAASLIGVMSLSVGAHAQMNTATVSTQTTQQALRLNERPFLVQKSSTRSIKTGVSAFRLGDYAKAILFTNHALDQGLSKRRKSIAYNNLCAAHAKQGQADLAIKACDAAIGYNANNDVALANTVMLTSQ